MNSSSSVGLNRLAWYLSRIIFLYENISHFGMVINIYYRFILIDYWCHSKCTPM